MTIGGAPEDGDLVIRQHTRDGEVVYAVRIVHGADQYTVRSYGEAIAAAMRFARRQGVAVWLTLGMSDFTLVKNYRAGSDASPAKQSSAPPVRLRRRKILQS
jgi:hypothetical protein